MRLKLIQVGYTTFTGQLGTQHFTNGISDNDLTNEQAMHIAALLDVDWYNATGVGVWTATTAEALGVQILDANGNIWNVTTAGTTGSTVPAWPTTPTTSTTVADGTVTWTFLEKADAGVDDVTNDEINQLTDQQ